MLKQNHVIQDHHLIKNTRAIRQTRLDKLTGRKIYSMHHQALYQLPKNISTKFFQMKISTGKKIIYYQE